MTGLSTTTSLSSLAPVDWDSDVVKTTVACPTCGRDAVQLDILPWGISPIACDFCADEWDKAEGASSKATRADAFTASGIPEWAVEIEPDNDELARFLHGMAARGTRAVWIQRADSDDATKAACALLRAWMSSKTGSGAFRSGAYAMETAVYSRDGIGAAATAGMLVIDGFGKRTPSRYEAGRMRELVEYRRINRLPLVIATTLDVGRAGDVVGRSGGEGIAAMEAIVAMLRGLR